ncbi:TonB-dependent receptor plug domain-containing protein [Pseudomonas sp. 2FG]|uniref:TonB-dependent receptor plug domain-containing protein n=1 Tax=Pseudomonas sp. 2FG TaxID=2502191 RepID=UPI0021146822|nr:TonB-dependent receptor plug domain-containing protein [Pseudomonas sp. 2FG]
MAAFSARKPVATAVRAALFGLGLPLAALAADASKGAAAPTQQGDGQVELQSLSITGVEETESPFGPVVGYVAERNSTGTKTDTPILETPQSVSVITADRIRDQGAQSVQDALRYTAGVRGETYGLATGAPSVAAHR